jgi:hypothetical protein
VFCFVFLKIKMTKAIQEIYHKQGTKLKMKWNFLLSSHFTHNPKVAMRCEVLNMMLYNLSSQGHVHILSLTLHTILNTREAHTPLLLVAISVQE